MQKLQLHQFFHFDLIILKVIRDVRFYAFRTVYDCGIRTAHVHINDISYMNIRALFPSDRTVFTLESGRDIIVGRVCRNEPDAMDGSSFSASCQFMAGLQEIHDLCIIKRVIHDDRDPVFSVHMPGRIDPADGLQCFDLFIRHLQVDDIDLSGRSGPDPVRIDPHEQRIPFFIVLMPEYCVILILKGVFGPVMPQLEYLLGYPVCLI